MQFHVMNNRLPIATFKYQFIRIIRMCYVLLVKSLTLSRLKVRYEHYTARGSSYFRNWNLHLSNLISNFMISKNNNHIDLLSIKILTSKMKMQNRTSKDDPMLPYKKLNLLLFENFIQNSNMTQSVTQNQKSEKCWKKLKLLLKVYGRAW